MQSQNTDPLVSSFYLQEGTYPDSAVHPDMCSGLCDTIGGDAT